MSFSKLLLISNLFVAALNFPLAAQNPEDRIMYHYLKLSASLSRSDFKQAIKHAEKLSTFVGKSPYKGLQQHAESLKNAQNLNQIRVHFSPFSDSLTVLVKSNRIKSAESLYLIHCPMAFNDRGADWISDEPKVINPYFGDEMLHCGSVKGNIYKAKK